MRLEEMRFQMVSVAETATSRASAMGRENQTLNTPAPQLRWIER
jgi:hypothetical protein